MADNEEPRIVHRGIILVHGIGEQPKGDTLQFIGRPLLEHIEKSLQDQPHSVTFWAQEPNPKDDLPARSVITVKLDSHREETWEFVEAWWAASFIPPLRSQDQAALVRWAFKLRARHWPTAFNTWWLGVRPFFDTWWLGQKPSRVPLPNWAADEPAFQRTERQSSVAGWLRHVDLLSTIPWLIIGLVATLLGGLVALLIGIIALIPPLSGTAGTIMQGISSFLFRNLGDQWACTQDVLARAGATNVVVNTIRPFLANPNTKSITIVAHSGGCVPAFAAACDERLQASLASATAPPLTIYTVGSALNAAYMMDKDHALWRGRLGRVRWVDIWTQYDFVPGGAPHQGFRDKVIRADSQFVDIRVTNWDNPIEDHGAYFDSFRDVNARIMAGILREASGSPSANPLYEKLVTEHLADKALIQDERRRRGRFGFVRDWGAVLIVGIVQVFGLSGGVIQWMGSTVVPTLQDTWLLGGVLSSAFSTTWSTHVLAWAFAIVVAVAAWVLVGVGRPDERLQWKPWKAVEAVTGAHAAEDGTQ